MWSDERWKVARRCGAKHISKSKRAKHTILGPLLKVERSKKCTPLWREAHFQVRTQHAMFGPLLEVEMSKKCTPLWREVSKYKTHHVGTTCGSWDVGKSARRCGAKHISKSKVQKTDGYGALLDVQMSFRVASARDCAPGQKWEKSEGFVAVSTTTTTELHYTTTTTTGTATNTLHYTTLPYTALHYTTTTTTTTATTALPLHYITTTLQLHYHYTTPNSITFHHTRL